MAQTTENVGVHIIKATYQIHPPNAEDSDEVAAFINAFPEAPQQGEGYGAFLDFDVGFSDINGIGIGVARGYGKIDINKTADPANTPDDPSDDIYIKRVRRETNNVVFFMKAIRAATLGIGIEEGEFRFDIEHTDGRKEQRIFNFSYPYIHTSLSTATPGGGFYFSVVANIVSSSLGKKRGGFSGTTYAIAVGKLF